MTEPGTRLLGYVRLAPGTEDSTCRAQLEAAGAQRVFLDRPDPADPRGHPQWAACQEELRTGDTLLISRLDHLAATATMAVAVIVDLRARGVHLRSLTEPAIDTTATTTLGDVAAALAGLRTTTARERTRSGLARARTEGRVGGRPTVMDTARTQTAVQMRAGGAPIAAIAAALGVGASSVARALARTEPGAITQGAPRGATPAGTPRPAVPTSPADAAVASAT